MNPIPPQEYIGKRILFRSTEGREKGILQEGKVLGLSPSGLYIQIRALMMAGTGWMTKYDFQNKIEIMEVLGDITE